MTETPRGQYVLSGFRFALAGAAGAAALVFLGTLAIVEFGWSNVTATTPHNRFSAWIIHTTMIHAVQNGARAIVPPRHFTSTQVARGFGAYEAHCVMCHGAPGIRRALWVSGLTPPPPYLLDAARRWTPAELKFVIGNGVKMTAMPGWSITRSDPEIWDIVAFLERLPYITPAEYAQMRARSRKGSDKAW